MSATHEVAIVGAGVAGLAASRRLAERGIGHVLVEAGPRIGGRARTVRPALLGGALLDEGASWLHAPDRNPLVPLARARGLALEDAWADRRHLLFDGGRRACAAEADGAERDAVAYGALLDRRLDALPPEADLTVAEAGEPVRREARWGATAEAWESAVIAAADARRLSLRDCRRNALPGGDLAVPIGVGTLVETLLAPDGAAATLILDATVHRIDRTSASRVRLDTSRGTIEARRVVVTVSTGVLRSGLLRFAPALPHLQADAIARLPMGLLSKIALPLADGATTAAFSVPPGESALAERRVERPGDPFIVFHVAPGGARHLVGFFGGEAAWALAGDGAAAEAWARAELARLFGAGAVAATLGAGAHLTTWGTDPFFAGAYAYAGPGDAGPGEADARARLAEPMDDGRLVFAGEACRTDGIAGTVGGAATDGVRAADRVAADLRREGPA